MYMYLWSYMNKIINKQPCRDRCIPTDICWCLNKVTCISDLNHLHPPPAGYSCFLRQLWKLFCLVAK